MKRKLVYALTLALALGLTACGGGEPIPEAVPAPEIPSAEAIQDNPFAAYFDLSGLSQETLEGVIQDVAKENAPVNIHQSLGDGHNLYVAFDVVWQVGVDPTAELLQPTLTVGDPYAASSTYAGMVTGTQTGENTCSYIAAFYTIDNPLGKSVTFTLPVMDGVYAFNWTAKNVCKQQTADLTDESGTVVGTASITPFSLQFTVEDAYVSGIGNGDTIQLLDETGVPLPETWATSGDPSAAFLEFFVPMELGTVKTLQVGPYTGQF